jgi:hypothetical protein
MTNIVRSTYRYKRPPKRKKAVLLEVPAVVTISKKTRRRVPDEAKAAPAESTPANNDRRPAIVRTKQPKPAPAPAAARPSAIVTARRPGKRYVDVPEVSEEEHRRIGDLADAMMAEFKRVIAEKMRS